MDAEGVLRVALAAEITRAQNAEQQSWDADTAEQAARQLAIYDQSLIRIAAEAAFDARLDILEADPTTKAYVDGQIASVESNVEDLEAYAQDIRSDADSIDLRVAALEVATDGPVFYKEKLVIGTSAGATTSSLMLAHEAIANSIVVFVGRLGAHKDEDYTVSTEGGVSKLTWIGALASPDGAEAIENNDNIFITYAVLA